MKKGLLILGLFSAVASSQAVVLAHWTFEGATTPADQTNVANSSTWLAETGVYSGTAAGNGVHASANTDWTTPSGNGSANSISSNEWAVGDYYQFKCSTLGYEDLKITWSQTASGTGPRDFKIHMSTDGITFNPLAGYTVLFNGAPNPAWSSGSPAPIYNYLLDLTVNSSFDNQANVYIRLVMDTNIATNGSPVGTNGANRVDDMKFDATAVPEPATMAALGLGVAAFIRRRRK